MSKPPEPGWPTCQADPSCIGIQVEPGSACLAHRSTPDRLEVLRRLGPGADIDVRGVPIDTKLLDDLLAAVKDPGTGRAVFGHARFDRAQFTHAARIPGEFRGDAVFSHATFSGYTEFNAVTFAARARFHATRFDGTVRFTETRFEGDAIFVRAVFDQVASFNCFFNGLAQFGRRATSDSTGAKFNGPARFNDVTFRGEAIFGGARVLGQQMATARLPEHQRERMARSVAGGVEFNDGVSFEGATFGQLAAFQGTTFAKITRFDRATFAETAQFTDSKFNALVTFDTALFEGAARFVGATFGSEPNFTATTFRQLADFHDATFPSDSNLGPCTAHHLNVSGVRVSGPFTIQCRMFQQFTAVNLHCADKLNLQLDGAIIVDATAIRSAGSLTLDYKHGDLTVGDVAFDSPSTISSGMHTPVRLLTLNKVDATNLTLAGLRLDACRFSDCYNRDSLRIEGPPQFASTPDEGFWANRQVLAEEHLWRTRYDRRPRGWFPDTSWHPDESPPKRWGFSRTEPEVRHEAALIQSIYRDLRKGREDAKDEPGAADFYFGEMEMRRMAAPPRSLERALLTAYWAVSGYGLRAARALVALLFVLVLGTVGFATEGFAPSAVITYEPVPPSQANQPIAYRQITVAGPRPGWATAIDHTVDSATSLLRATTPRPLTSAGRILEVTLRLLGPLLLGLSVLALRTRVKR